MPHILIAAALLCLVPLSASAQIYQYTDKEGRTHYVGDISKVPQEYRDASHAASLPELSKVPAMPLREAPGEQPPAQPRPSSRTAAPKRVGPVEIYVTSWCPYCKKLEEYLNANQIRYTRFDIEKSDDGRKRYQKLGHPGVPVIKVGSQVVTGFNPDQLGALLKR